MRILVVCDHGQCRSVAMATVLHEMGHEAIPVSLKTALNDMQGSSVLHAWADTIWRMDELANGRMSHNLGYNHHNAWIGRDKWANPCVPELVELCKKKAQELLSK